MRTRPGRQWRITMDLEPTLPVREPAHDPMLPSSERTQVPQSSPAGARPRSREERIRFTTAAGGLEELPTGFDDADGDWTTIASPSLFERLYLDAAQYAVITPSAVQKNYSLLHKFWTDRIAAMHTGAAKAQLLKKFGGPHRSEELLLSYPRELKKAADRLSTIGGILAHYEELQVQRRAAALIVVEPLIDVLMSDGSIERVETESYFARALVAGFTIDEAASLLHDRITERDFQPVTAPEGSSLDARLRSVQWLSRERLAQLQAVPAPSEPQLVPIIPQNVVPSARSPLLTVALITLLVISAGIVLLIQWLRPRNVPPVSTTTQQAAVLITVPTNAAPPPAPSPVPVVTPPPSTGTSEPPRVDTAAEELARMKQEAADLERQRQRNAEQEEAARTAREAQRLARLREAIDAAYTRAAEQIDEHDFEAARSTLDNARSMAVADSQVFAAQLSDIDALRREAERRLLHDAVLRTRLAEIDGLNNDKKYTAAINVANRLLQEPELPDDVIEHAKRAIATAQEELRKAFANTDLKGVTTRRTNRGRNQ